MTSFTILFQAHLLRVHVAPIVLKDSLGEPFKSVKFACPDLLELLEWSISLRDMNVSTPFLAVRSCRYHKLAEQLSHIHTPFYFEESWGPPC